jgi:hypothetical protein
MIEKKEEGWSKGREEGRGRRKKTSQEVEEEYKPAQQRTEQRREEEKTQTEQNRTEQKQTDRHIDFSCSSFREGDLRFDPNGKLLNTLQTERKKRGKEGGEKRREGKGRDGEEKEKERLKDRTKETDR